MVVGWDGKALTRIMTETSIEQLSTISKQSVSIKLKRTLVHFLSNFFITKYLYVTLIFCLNCMGTYFCFSGQILNFLIMQTC